jgi:hypothetical protein
MAELIKIKGLSIFGLLKKNIKLRFVFYFLVGISLSRSLNDFQSGSNLLGLLACNSGFNQGLQEVVVS